MKHSALLFASFLVAAAAGLPQTGKLNCPEGFSRETQPNLEPGEHSGLTNVLCEADATVAQKSCAHGHLFQDSTCFWLGRDEIYSWREAVAACADIGMTIASVHSPEEDAFIWGLGYGSSMWIGLNDLVREGNFNWADGTAVDYTNWRLYEPDGGDGSNCVFMFDDNDGEWADRPCSVSTGVVCRGVPN